MTVLNNRELVEVLKFREPDLGILRSSNRIASNFTEPISIMDLRVERIMTLPKTVTMNYGIYLITSLKDTFPFDLLLIFGFQLKTT